jgi:hypothetical protein
MRWQCFSVLGKSVSVTKIVHVIERQNRQLTNAVDFHMGLSQCVLKAVFLDRMYTVFLLSPNHGALLSLIPVLGRHIIGSG